MTGARVLNFEADDTGEPLGYGGTFLSGELERAYRQSRLEEDLPSVSVIFAVTMIGVLSFIINDYRLFGIAMPFPLILGFRLGICALSVGVWMKLRSAVHTLQPQRFDRALLSWSVILAAALVYVSFTRPANSTGHFLVHLFTILLTYCVVPLPLFRQAIPALLISIGMTVCLALKPPADGITSTALLWTVIAANVLGASISRQLHRSGRMQFLALTREKKMRMGLETALAELKTLRGIIPICSHCKNIRD
ncbi:MAG: hypothetical protein EOP84_17330, partial [Verrucomicrobiaceae bacterium]